MSPCWEPRESYTCLKYFIASVYVWCVCMCVCTRHRMCRSEDNSSQFFPSTLRVLRIELATYVLVASTFILLSHPISPTEEIWSLVFVPVKWLNGAWISLHFPWECEEAASSNNLGCRWLFPMLKVGPHQLKGSQPSRFGYLHSSIPAMAPSRSCRHGRGGGGKVSEQSSDFWLVWMWRTSCLLMNVVPIINLKVGKPPRSRPLRT